MNTENIKTILLVAAAVIIGGLGYKVFFEQKDPAPQYPQQANKDGKFVSPYHDRQVKNTIMKNRGDIIECYNAFIDTNPQVTDGPLKVDFEIDDDGEVTRTGIISGPFIDEKFLGCITGKIKSWKFPEPDIPAPVYVDHTFNFKKRVETPQEKK